MNFVKDIQRVPGQSLSEKIEGTLDEKILMYLFFIGVLTFLIIFSWGIWIFDTLPNPVVITFLSLTVMTVSVYRLSELRQELKHNYLGLDGERFVAQHLEELRSIGYKVFHDVIAEGFNLDHVLIGPAGIFVIETKTWSKYHKIRAVKYSNGLFLNGHRVHGDPVHQTKHAAKWLSELLNRSIGKRYSVSPIIALPNKYIYPEVNKTLQTENILLINPKNIYALLKDRPAVLITEQINQLSLHLSDYCKLKKYNK